MYIYLSVVKDLE